MQPYEILCISSPSGGGKGLLVREIRRSHDQHFDLIVSKTNRDRRAEEVDGREYDFISTEYFHELIHHKALVECEEVYPGRFYGTPKSEIERITAEGKTPIADIDVKGAMRIKEVYGARALCVAIVPISERALIKALRSREGGRDPEGLKRRIMKMPEELAFIDKCGDRFDLRVVNTFELDCLPVMMQAILDRMGIVVAT